MASLNRSLWRVSVPSMNFFVLLALSNIIATLGLLADSAATVIGAMIVAPLMGPILGIAYSMVVGNRRLLKRSGLTLLAGVVMVVLLSIIIAAFVGLRTLNDQITARAYPTLIDLGVALAAGSAGAFAKSRRGVADALPGVAIAVALVPPLSVVGIGLALRSSTVATGATLLFLTNLAGIIFSGGLVFLGQRYGSLAKAKRGLVVSIISLSLLGIPLGFSLRNLLIRANVRRSVAVLITRRTLTFSDKDLRSVRVRSQEGELLVELEVAAPLNSISEYQVQLVRAFLEKELKEPINLEVRVIPVVFLEAK
ncbi:MAG: TIGR00341 family protein [Chroococcales cyanobacterium]